jgi:hypothetical protein
MSEPRVSTSSHLALALSARPTRLGLLVAAEVQGIPWPRVFESALAAQARFWGGSGNLVFPLTEDFAEKELFWALADRFDADAFVTYAPIWGEVEEFAPEIFRAHVTKWRESITEQISADAAETFITDQFAEIAFEFRPTDADLDLLRHRVAPFHHDPPCVLDHFNGQNSAAWPFTDISEFVQLPGAITNPVSPAGAARKLLLTAITGRVPVGFAAQLAERDVGITEERLRRSYSWANVVVDRGLGPRPGGC